MPEQHRRGGRGAHLAAQCEHVDHAAPDGHRAAVGRETERHGCEEDRLRGVERPLAGVGQKPLEA